MKRQHLNTDLLGLLFWILIMAIFFSSCRSVKTATVTTVRDSVITREFEVPVKIKEQTIRQEISLDSLCNELEALKAQLRDQKLPPTQIIYRQINNQLLQGKIDSLGRLLLTSQRQAMDTIIKGQETIKTKTTTTETTTEKQARRVPWYYLIGLGIFLGVIVVILLKKLLS